MIGFSKLSIEDVRNYFDAGEAGKCFKVYGDGSMEKIDPDTSWEELGYFANNGGEFAYRLPFREIVLPNGGKAAAPENIDISTKGSLDRERGMLQETIRAYFDRFGVICRDVDKDLVLHMESSLVDMLEAAGASFSRSASNGTNREINIVVTDGIGVKNVISVMSNDLGRSLAAAGEAKSDYYGGDMEFDTDFTTVLGEYLKRDGIKYRFVPYTVYEEDLL